MLKSAKAPIGATNFAQTFHTTFLHFCPKACEKLAESRKIFIIMTTFLARTLLKLWKISREKTKIALAFSGYLRYNAR